MSQSVQRIPLQEIDQKLRPPAIQRPKAPVSPVTVAPVTPARAGSRLVRLRELRNRLAGQALTPLSACLGPRFADSFGILMYHRVVAPPAGVVAPTWNVSPQHFRAQLAGLLKRGYRPWPLREVLAFHNAGRPIPPKTFVVTFDDGYDNVYRNAFPVLREYGIPATIFLTTGYLDSVEAFPFDDWSCAGSPNVPSETWRPLTTAQCKEMLASGLVELAAHTHNHIDFRGCPDVLRSDFAVSLEVLRDRFRVTEASFAFPFGNGCRKIDGPELSEVAKEAGVTCALTTDSELVRPGDDPLNWGRFAAFDTDSAASLAAKLDGWYSLVRSTWKRLRRQPDRARRPHGQCTVEGSAAPGTHSRETVWTH